MVKSNHRAGDAERLRSLPLDHPGISEFVFVHSHPPKAYGLNNIHHSDIINDSR